MLLSRAKQSSIKKCELFVHVFTQQALREIHFLDDVYNERAKPKDDFISKLIKRVRVAISILPFASKGIAMIETAAAVAEAMGVAIEQPILSAAMVAQSEVTAALQRVEKKAIARQEEKAARVAERTFAGEQSALELLLFEVAHQAIYRYEAGLNQLEEADVALIARIGVARILEYIASQDKELTVENMLTGLLEGRSGGYIEGFRNNRLKLGDSTGEIRTAEGFFGRGPLLTPDGRHWVSPDYPKSPKSLPLRVKASDGGEPKYRPIRVEADVPRCYNYQPYSPPRALPPQSMLFREIESSTIQEYLRAVCDGSFTGSLNEYVTQKIAPAGETKIALFRGSLAGENLSKGNFTGSYFPGADLSDCCLERVIFTDAYLIGVNLCGANAQEACFFRARLSRSQADARSHFDRANFNQAIVTHANWSGSSLVGIFALGTDWERADLRHVKQMSDSEEQAPWYQELLRAQADYQKDLADIRDELAGLTQRVSRIEMRADAREEKEAEQDDQIDELRKRFETQEQRLQQLHEHLHISDERRAAEFVELRQENQALRAREEKNAEKIRRLEQAAEQQSQAQARREQAEILQKQTRAREELEDEDNGVSFERAQAVFHLCAQFPTLHTSELQALQEATKKDTTELTRILRRMARYRVLNKSSADDFLQAYRSLPDIWRPEFFKQVERALRLGQEALLLAPFACSTITETLMHFPNRSGVRLEAQKELEAWQELLVALVCINPEAAESKNELLLPLQIAGMDLRAVREIPATAFYKGHYYLRPDLAVQILEEGFANFKPKPQNQSGKHVVLPVHINPLTTPNLLPDVVFKLYPEQPGVEQAVTSLNRLVVGSQVVPRAELLRLEFKGECIPVLMSRYIQGINFSILLSALEKPQTEEGRAHQVMAQERVSQIFGTTAEEVIIHFDPIALSELFLMMLFTKPEDGSPSNHMVVRKRNARGEGVYYLIPHDNDHAFVKEALVKTKEGYQAEVKTILYCLDAMQQPIAEEVLQAFLNLQPSLLLGRWLTEQLVLTNRYQAIFSAEDVRQLRFQVPNYFERMWGKTDRGCLIPMPFREGLTGDLWRIFDRLKSILNTKPTSTLMEILLFVEPELAKVYQSAFELHPVSEVHPEHADARFVHVTRHSMSRDRHGHWRTETRLGEMQKKMLGADISYLTEPEVMRILTLAERSAQQAKEELDLYAHKESHFPAIAREMMSGNFKRFQLLKNMPAYQADILDRIDFAQTDAKTQQLIIGEIKATMLPVLNLRNCTALTALDLTLILSHMQSSLEVVDLSLAPEIARLPNAQLRDSHLTQLSNCPNLIKLNLKGRNEFQRGCGNGAGNYLVFRSLKRLILNYGLKDIRLETPKLSYVDAEDLDEDCLLAIQNIAPNCRWKFVKHLQLREGLQAYFPSSLSEEPSEDYADSYYRRGIAKADLGEIESAIADFDESLKFKQDADTYYERGVAKHRLKQFSEATVDYEETLRLNPGYVLAADNSKVAKNGSLFSKILNGHTNRVTDLAVFPDGRFASGSNGDRIWSRDKIRIWSRSGSCEQKFESSAASDCLKVLPNGRLVSLYFDEIKLWSIDGMLERTLVRKSRLSNHTYEYLNLFCLAVFPDGSLVCGGKINIEVHSDRYKGVYRRVDSYRRGIIELWSKNGEFERRVKYNHCVICLAVFPDGSFMSGSADNTIKLWTRDGKCRRTSKGHKKPVLCLDIFPDGSFVSGSADNTIKLWSKNGECEQTLEGHTAPVGCLAVFPDGSFVSGSNDNTIRLWSTKGLVARLVVNDPQAGGTVVASVIEQAKPVAIPKALAATSDHSELPKAECEIANEVHPCSISEVLGNAAVTDDDAFKKMQHSPDKKKEKRVGATMPRGVGILTAAYSASRQKLSPFSGCVDAVTLEKKYHETLLSQEQCRKELGMQAVHDFEILTAFYSISPQDEHFEQKKRLYDLTWKLVCLNQELFNLAQKGKRLEVERTPQTANELYAIVNDKRIEFDMGPVLGDGWCTLNAIGIAKPESALEQLKQHLIDPLVIEYLTRAIHNNVTTYKTQAEDFQVSGNDNEGNNILDKINFLYQVVQDAESGSPEHQNAYAQYLSYLGRQDVLNAYLDYLIKDKYVDINIAAACLWSSHQQRLFSFHKFPGSDGRLASLAADDFDPSASNNVILMYEPGVRQRQAHYSVLRVKRITDHLTPLKEDHSEKDITKLPAPKLSAKQTTNAAAAATADTRKQVLVGEKEEKSTSAAFSHSAGRLAAGYSSPKRQPSSSNDSFLELKVLLQKASIRKKGIEIVTFIYQDSMIANQTMKQLREYGFVGDANEPRKINMPKPDEFEIVISLEEYDALFGDGAFEELEHEQSMAMGNA